MIRLSALMALVGLPVLAQEPECATLNDVKNMLAEAYDERQIGVGLDQRGFVMMLFASPAGTWTVVYADPSGQACLAAAGTDLMVVDLAQVLGESG